MNKWIPICDKLPEIDRLVLARGTTHDGVALAKFTCDSVWQVQPYKDAWYFTEKGISEWTYIPDMDEATEACDTPEEREIHGIRVRRIAPYFNAWVRVDE